MSGISTGPGLTEFKVGVSEGRSFLWPDGAPFAMLLSHDIDQIHDREMWRILGDLNHVRRMVLGGEKGRISQAATRIGRALFAPKPAVRDFETILKIEGRHGFHSTFFVLHDRYWARQGARFRITDPELRAIVELIKGAGCEVGVHGGYYRFNDTDAYLESRRILANAFEVEPVGIRNHLLRFSGVDTWQAQANAGFSYDATFGYKDRTGPRDERYHPFWAIAPDGVNRGGLIELPLTVMDTTLFRHHRLTGQAALDAAWAAITPVVEASGLVTLLWHGNFFNEPEYWDWQWVYEELLDRLAKMKPWCATGAEIDRWWRLQKGTPRSSVLLKDSEVCSAQ